MFQKVGMFSYMRVILGICICVLLASGPAFAVCSKTFKIAYSDWIKVEAELGDKIVDFGMDFEILDAVFAIAGCQFEKKAIPFNRMMKAIERGHVDGTMGASLTVFRQEYAWFTAPYRQEVMAIFMLRDQIERFSPTSLNDLKVQKLQLGLGLGSWHGEKFEKMVESDPEFRTRLRLYK